ncbi:MAG: type I-F CRISPR-associated protein Csy1 [Porticoccaceae bacterium]|nr:type I-F CRISPR-associated protein Csy1 [Porticoccaceae bacterium]
MLNDKAVVIKTCLRDYVDGRREMMLKKWEGKSDTESKKKIEKINTEYHLEYILSEGAKYADQVAIASHLAKATHPDLKVKNVTNPSVIPERPVGFPEVGSHSIPVRDQYEDATGNGAINKKCYELHLLLQVPIKGASLRDLLEKQDQAAIDVVREALPGEKGVEAKLLALYTIKSQSLASHLLMKQVYWCVSGEPTQDDGYHLLQPMFPACLVHTVYLSIYSARFGGDNENARKARSEKRAHSGEYHQYPKLAVQKLGGTKPQNISQLNSERGGVNYLLSSAPPSWRSSEVASLLGVETVMNAFRRTDGVESMIRRLVSFLQSEPPANEPTRAKVERYVRALAEALANFGKQVIEAKPTGWTASSECRLDLHEKVWLDRGRLSLIDATTTDVSDKEFKAAADWLDWPDEIAECFAQWLNGILRKADLPVGDADFKHWARQALVDAEWPATFRRKAPPKSEVREVGHA